jgi:hypothetical protein
VSNPLVKEHWLDRAIAIRNFHVQQLLDEPKWSNEKTDRALNRSIGSVATDLKLASWSRSHDKQLRRCSSMRDAIKFIQDKEREIELESL